MASKVVSVERKRVTGMGGAMLFGGGRKHRGSLFCVRGLQIRVCRPDCAQLLLDLFAVCGVLAGNPGRG